MDLAAFALSTRGRTMELRTRAALAVTLAIAILVGAPMAIAHERWLLTPYQMQHLISAPAPDVMQNFGPILGLVAIASIVAILVAKGLDQALAQRREQFQERWGERLLPWALLVLRVGLAVEMVDAALGLAPRHGSALQAQPTLFFPDLEIRLLGPTANWLIPVQIALAGMLALGFKVRIAASAVLALLGYAAIQFDAALIFTYAGHVAASAILLALTGSGRLAVSPDSHQAGPGRTARAFAIFRIVIGINFIALAFLDKVLNTNLLIHVLTATNFPTVGFPVEIVAMIMAAVELSLGVMLVVGVMTRAVAAALLAAMLLFVITMNESIHMHAHLYAGAIAMLVIGGGRIRESGNAPESALAGFRQGLLRPNVATAGAVFAGLVLGLAPIWLVLIPRHVGDVSFLQLASGAEAPEVGLATEVDDDGTVHVLIDTRNFKLADVCQGGPNSGASGHIHVYVDGQLYDTSSIGAVDVVGLAHGRHQVSAVLVSTTHRSIVVGERVVAAAADVVVPAPGAGSSQASLDL